MKIFSEIPLQTYLEQTQLFVIQSIEKESDQIINNINEENYLKQKIQEAYIEPVILQLDKLHITLSEQMIPGDRFPSIFTVQEGKSYKKEVIKFHIPYSGHTKLFTCHPKDDVGWTMEIELKDDEFCFEIVNFSNNTNGMNNEKESNLRSISQQFQDITAKLNQYNSGISAHIQQALDARRSK